MKTKHVPTLKLCQTFATLCKEKGIVVPETEFVWAAYDGYWEITTMKEDHIDIRYADEVIPAPLVSELGEWMGCYAYTEKYLDKSNPNYNEARNWFAIRHETDMDKLEGFNTEANARQKMINYLIAEGIITTL